MSTQFAIVLLCSIAATRVAAATVEVQDTKGIPLPGVQVVVVDEGEHKTLSAETDDAGVATIKLNPGTKVSLLCGREGFKGWHKANVELVENQTIKLRATKDGHSLIFTEADGQIPGLSGKLTVISDQTRRLRLYSENMFVNEKRQTLVPIKLRQKTRLTDMNKNSAEITVVGAAGSAILMDYNVHPFVAPKAAAQNGAEFTVRDRRGNPIEDADVVLVNVRNNTNVVAKTNELGDATLKGFPNEPVLVYCGHRNFRAYREMLDSPYGSHRIALIQQNGIGSVVFSGRTGYISGLKGRLNPILDNLGRYYLYADNIALDGGKQQPVHFSLGSPIDATDAEGTLCQLLVVEIKGDTSLIEFQFP